VISTMSRRASVAGLAVLLAYAPPALAQTAASAADQATEYFQNGSALYKQSKFTEAEVQFQKAWDARKSFDVAANLGDCEIEIGQNREAAEHLAYAVREFPLSGKPALRDRLQQRFALARTRVGALKVRVSVPGAEVAVDDRVIGNAPLEDEVFVEPGAHAVTARLGEYETGRASVEVGKGASQEVTVVLVKRDTTVIFVKKPLWPVIVAGGATVVALGVGTGLTVAANGKGADRATLLGGVGTTGCAQPSSANKTNCATLLSTAQSQSMLRNGAMGAFVAGGALALVTGGLAVWTLSKRPAPRNGMRFQVAPALGATERGVVVSGTW
jgi:hypothetical protein